MTEKIWTVNYRYALPLTLQDFSIGAVLPAMLYMARWGHRRGQGSFVRTFQRKAPDRPTIEDVAHTLSRKAQWFEGFEGEAAEAILGDLLLSFCLENTKRKQGRREQVQRVFPTHYFSSWIDLPEKIANLRNVPELLTVLLANQRVTTSLTTGNTGGSRFAVGVGPDENLLLQMLSQGLLQGESKNNLAGDRYDEKTVIGVDQLLTIRLALACGSAPNKSGTSGQSGSIPNQHPLAHRAADHLREDLRLFISSYGQSIPRRSLLPMLEVCAGIGMANLMLSTLQMMSAWERDGSLPHRDKQVPWPLFVDCSNSADPELRLVSEASTDQCFRQLARLPLIFMCLRTLEYQALNDRFLKPELPIAEPDATSRVNMLGQVLMGQHARSGVIQDRFFEHCQALTNQLVEKGIGQPAIDALNNMEQPNFVWRLSEAVSLLMGDKQQRQQLNKFFANCMMTNEEHGLARSRRVLDRVAENNQRTKEATSTILSNTALDYLVHRSLCKSSGRTRIASLSGFIDTLKLRYGFYIDEAPPGTTLSQELLLRNRQVLERRLRDLGVLIGVNDAESMKRLKPRFKQSGNGE
jgi:hypothetical protein